MVTPTAAAAAAAAADRHKKFYLCAAPKAVDYDQRVDGLLRGFGGRSKAREVVRTTLDRVQNTHKWQRKTGPGRKSNAEHAIHFYEYVLDQLGSEDEEGNESSGADEGTEEEEQSNLLQKQSENEEDESASNAEGNDDSASSEPEEIRSDLCNGMYTFLLLAFSSNHHQLADHVLNLFHNLLLMKFRSMFRDAGATHGLYGMPTSLSPRLLSSGHHGIPNGYRLEVCLLLASVGTKI